MLVIVGADAWGNKDVLGLIDGFRESTQSWRELLLDLNRRPAKRNAGAWRPRRSWLWAKVPWGSGLPCMRSTARPGCSAAGCTTEGMTAIGPKECPKANVLNAMPKSVQPKAKAHLKDICPHAHALHALPGNRWPKPRPGQMLPSISSSRLTA